MDQLTAETVNTKPQRQDQRVLEEALASTGLLQTISPDLIAAYGADPTTPRQSPVHVQGKSLSAVITDQRERTE